MNVGRIGATSFIYENQVFVAGGCDSDVIDVLNVNLLPRLQWDKAIVPLPCHSQRICSVVYQNRAVLFCPQDETDDMGVVELCLNAPYTCDQLCNLPGPERKNYRVVAFEHRVLIFGGRSVTNDYLLDGVLEFDVTTK